MLRAMHAVWPLQGFTLEPHCGECEVGTFTHPERKDVSPWASAVLVQNSTHASLLASTTPALLLCRPPSLLSQHGEERDRQTQ